METINIIPGPVLLYCTDKDFLRLLKSNYKIACTLSQFRRISKRAKKLKKRL